MATDEHAKQTDEARQERCVPFDEFLADAAALFDEAAAGVRVTVERDGLVFRLAPLRRRSRRARHPITADDPLWDIVGIGRTEGPTDVSSNKHKYIADAIAAHFERSHGDGQQAPVDGEGSDTSQGLPASSNQP